MKRYIFLFFILSLLLSNNILKLPLSHKGLDDRPAEYERGIYLIVLGSGSITESTLINENLGGDFVEFKKTQGYDVEVVSIDDLGINSNLLLKSYLQNYKDNNPMLEYVLLIGDWNGSYSAIPTFTIPSYNFDELDVTDYTYTYIDEDVENPRFFIGRWPVQSTMDLLVLKAKTIEHTKLEKSDNIERFNKALLVAGNFKDGQGVQPWDWPVTPRWTNMWLQDQLYEFGFSDVDTAFFHMGNPVEENPTIANSWNEGVGIINYRGWGDANGWHKPLFHRQDAEQLLISWDLPIVFSFVCNTGDFGNDYSGQGLDKCFGESIITEGNVTNPKGAVAMVGPSDLDTDTRFNNVMCGAMWDEILELRKTELAPALHVGKDSVKTEFDGLVINNTDIPGFYYHIYGVLGDPSIPIRLTSPTNLSVIGNTNLTESFISLQIVNDDGETVKDVVAAIIYDGELIGKDLSNQNGWIDINLENQIDIGAEMNLYLNHADYFQEKISITFESDSGSDFFEHAYEVTPEPISDFIYNISLNDGTLWEEISLSGTNLCLTDDTVTDIELPFSFNFYGNTYNSITVSSNGWASLEKCEIPYFWNFSIPFPLGPSAMLAPFMDDLDDNGKEPFNDENGNCTYDNGEWYHDRNSNGYWDQGEDFDVYAMNDTDDDRFIIQWQNVSNGEDDDNCPECVKNTFQLMIYNQEVHQNLANQGDIVFVYQETHDIDDNGNFSTIGIESPDQNFGSQVVFNGGDSNIMPNLNNGYSIRFTADNNPLNINENQTIVHSLLKAYPNPFNPSLSIEYSIDKGSNVYVSIYDINGRLVESVLDVYQSAGTHKVRWEPKDMSAGVYIVKLKLNSDIYTQRVTLLK
tara:strand:- start:4613 stop:7192 length:2580 start_codon:yes stop_codon:yes gene_type:complete